MPIELLVIHNISLPPDQFRRAWAWSSYLPISLDPAEHPYYAEIQGMKVSAHFFIRRDGSLIQFVSCLERAWHAGASQWQGRERCNDFSVGVELRRVATAQPFEDAQYAVLNTAFLPPCGRPILSKGSSDTPTSPLGARPIPAPVSTGPVCPPVSVLPAFAGLLHLNFCARKVSTPV